MINGRIFVQDLWETSLTEEKLRYCTCTSLVKGVRRYDTCLDHL